MRRVGVGWLWLLGALLIVQPAAAQNSIGTFAGQATGHIGVATGTDGQGSTLSLGASVAVVDDSGWGAEFDFGYADDDNGRTGGLDAQSYLINVIGIWPKGRIRPFFVGGGGVVRARTCTAGCGRIAAWTDWAVSGGGGVQYRLQPAAALTADVRHFSVPGTNPDHPNGLGFWRISIGATFLWDEP